MIGKTVEIVGVKDSRYARESMIGMRGKVAGYSNGEAFIVNPKTRREEVINHYRVKFLESK